MLTVYLSAQMVRNNPNDDELNVAIAGGAVFVPKDIGKTIQLP